MIPELLLARLVRGGTSWVSGDAMRLIFIGWYNRRNVGDESFKLVHRFLFPDLEKIWLENATGFEFQEGDIVVVGAGDVVKPYYIETLPRDIRFFIYGCGLTGSDDLEYLVSQKYRLYGAWFRNRADVDALAAHGISSRYTPDVCLQLAGQLALGSPEHLTRKRIAFLPSNGASRSYERKGDIRGASYMNYFVHECAAIIDDLSQYYDVDLIAMSGDNNDDDLAFVNSVFGLSANRGCMSVHEYHPDPVRTIEIISAATLCITMKYHGIIYSLVTGKPFIDIGMTRKNEIFCLENGFGEVSVPHNSLHQGRFANIVKVAESEQILNLVSVRGKELADVAREEGQLFREALFATASAV